MSGILQATGQSFGTLPLPNYQPAVYTLSIRQAGNSFEYAGYNFPITPASIRKEYAALTGIYDVQGSSKTRGVARQADVYGATPPTFMIEGTTGWQRHSADGYVLTGLESIQLLQAFLAQYDTLNAQALANASQNVFTLEFYDYFLQEYWQIEPVGPQGFYQDNQRPLFTNYRFRWAAIKELSQPPLGEADALLQVFGTSAATSVINAGTTLAGLSALYLGPAFSPSALL